MKRQGLGTFDFEKLITVDLAKETLTAEAYDKICEGNTVRLKANVFCNRYAAADEAPSLPTYVGNVGVRVNGGYRTCLVVYASTFLHVFHFPGNLVRPRFFYQTLSDACSSNSTEKTSRLFK